MNGSVWRWSVLSVFLPWLGAVLSAASPASGTPPRYLQVRTAPTETVLLQFQADEMRVAPSAAGLAGAVPSRGTPIAGAVASRGRTTVASGAGPAAPQRWRFEPVELPLGRHPVAGVAPQVYARVINLTYSPDGPARATVSFAIEQGGADQERWRCELSAMPAQELGRDPVNAPVLALDLGETVGLRLQVVPVGSNGTLKVGLRVTDGLHVVSGLTRGGTPVKARIVLTVADGRAVANHTGTLADFGFG